MVPRKSWWDSPYASLQQKLPANRSELVLFDFNRADGIQHFVVDRGKELLDELTQKAPADFEYTLVTNTSQNSFLTEARSRKAGAVDFSIQPLATPWPGGVYSLSHVAIPFKATDSWYGVLNDDGTPNLGTFGSVAPRGDQTILAVPLSRLMRLRYNPFFDYMQARTLGFCEVCLKEAH